MNRRNRKKKPTPKSHPYRNRFLFRSFLSLVLVLSALYIRQNEPALAAQAREMLHTSTDFAALAGQFILKP